MSNDGHSWGIWMVGFFGLLSMTLVFTVCSFLFSLIFWMTKEWVGQCMIAKPKKRSR